MGAGADGCLCLSTAERISRTCSAWSDGASASMEWHEAPCVRRRAGHRYTGNRVCVLWMARLRDAFGDVQIPRAMLSGYVVVAYPRSVKEVIQPQVPLRLP